MRISEIREAFNQSIGDFPEDMRKSLSGKLGLQPYQIGYANDPFGDDSCYFILNTDDGVFVVDAEKDCIVVREIK